MSEKGVQFDGTGDDAVAEKPDEPIKDNIYFYHGTLAADGTRYTIAGTIVDDDMILGCAICSKENQFSKKIGRDKAQGRMKASLGTRGRGFIGLYTSDMPSMNSGEFNHDGHQEDYWKGQELKVFRTACNSYMTSQFIHNLELINKKGLQKAFNL